MGQSVSSHLIAFGFSIINLLVLIKCIYEHIKIVKLFNLIDVALFSKYHPTI